MRRFRPRPVKVKLGWTDLHKASAAVLPGKLRFSGRQISLSKHGYNRPAADVFDDAKHRLPGATGPVCEDVDRRLTVYVTDPVRAAAQNQRKTVGKNPRRLIDNRRMSTNRRSPDGHKGKGTKQQIDKPSANKINDSTATSELQDKTKNFGKDSLKRRRTVEKRLEVFAQDDLYENYLSRVKALRSRYINHQ